MRALSAEQRQVDLERMAREGVDVLVIGGGITGAGVALDAATRGYRVGLVEKDDFAAGTSGWSTKLVHGGIRYLPQGDVALVREALIERGRLLANAPHLVRPLRFVLPLYASSRRPVGLPVAMPGGFGLSPTLDLGLAMYDMLAGRQNVARHRRVNRAEVLRLAPCLRPDGLRTGFLYYDGQTDDTRLTLAVIRSAAEAGALVANHALVAGFERGAGNALKAALVKLCAPAENGREIVIPARYIVNATGVFAEEVEALSGETPRLAIEPSKGVHLVLRAADIDVGDDAVVLPETQDGRIIFLVPWRSRVIAGTTDTGAGDLDHPAAADADVDYLLDHINRSVRRTITRAHVVSTYAGYRPLVQLRHQRTPSRLSRQHAIVEGSGGLISVTGGKLTTYRIMAEQVVDRIDVREGGKRSCLTRTLPIAGADKWPEAMKTLGERGARLGLLPATVAHLGASYGTLAHEVLDLVEGDVALALPLDVELPAIMAEVVYAARAEQALTLADALERRVRLGLEAGDHGVGIAPAAATWMARELGWSVTEQQAQMIAYAHYETTHDAGLGRDQAEVR